MRNGFFLAPPLGLPEQAGRLRLLTAAARFRQRAAAPQGGPFGARAARASEGWAADARITAVIERLNDLTQLEELFQRVRSVGSWQELFGQPATGPRRGRRRPSP